MALLAYSLVAASVFSRAIQGAPLEDNGSLHHRQVVNNPAPGYDRLGGKDFPDPCIYINPVNGDITSAATNQNGHLIQLAGADDFFQHDWALSPNEMFTSPPAWATSDYWAPDVGKLTDGDQSYFLYYSAKYNDGRHCIGLARAPATGDINGPYSDNSAEPFICPSEEEGGAIDPAGFLDESTNTRWIVYKVDGQAASGTDGGCGPENPGTPIILQQVDHDGYTIGSNQPITILNNNGADDEYNVEAPSICRSAEGVYFLFFSSHCYDGPDYQVNYVTSSGGIEGPYDSERGLVFSSNTFGLSAPGGADVNHDCTRMVFHANGPNGRSLHSATIDPVGRDINIVSGTA